MKKILSFGAGHMAQALMPPLSKDYHLTFYSPSGVSAKNLADQTKGSVLQNLNDLKFDYYFLCCKPQQFLTLANDIKGRLDDKALIVSIMAGVTQKTIKEELQHDRVLRLMPNTPSADGAGVSLYYGDGGEDNLILNFKKYNLLLSMKSEEQLDQVTAVTASGPAYLFELARILSLQLEKMGLNSDEAREGVVELFYGSALMMKNHKISLEELRNRVTSKGGVTHEALEIFKAKGLESMVESALEANFKRSLELSKQ